MQQNIKTWIGLAALLLAGLGWMTESATAQGFGTRRSGSTGGTGSANYPSGTELGTATFQVDPETRKLVVVTDDDTAKYISMVVSNLDRPAPQVLIKVVFLEVTYRKGYDVGIEGGTRQGINDSIEGKAVNAFGLSGLASSTGLVSNPFGQPVQSFAPTPPGAGLYQVLGSDFQVTLRAIATAGKTEVLSRPSVLARNNQQAIITVGQEIPLITNVRYDNFGNAINSVSYQPVGIILRVTPFITSQGMVEMVVSPEISNLSDQKVAIAAGYDAPVINSRTADTVVLTPDGQTVVIGGLMENRATESESKVPLLGDIPLLGMLFKRKIKDNVKTELLIFLTPHIVQQPAQLAGMTAKERSQLQLVPKSYTEQELDRFLDDLPTKDSAAEEKKKK